MRGLWKFLVVLPLYVQGQVNLVPNGGFEELTECPWSINQIQFASPWKNTGVDDTPDLFNVCAIPNPFPPYNNSAGVPLNATGIQQPYSGEGYCGLFTMSDPEQYPNSREYIQVKLLDSIIEKKNYVVSFHISLADRFQYALGSIGAFFSDSMISRETLQVLDVEPQIQSPIGVIYDDKENWMEVRDTFNSRFGGESWIVIGNFLADSLSQITFVDSGAGYNYDRSYYYIDDVSVIALDSVPSGLEEAGQGRNNFSVYPNPNNGRMTITYDLKEGESGELQIYTAMGELVMKRTLTMESSITEIDVLDISSGMYLLDIQINGEHRLTERLSILKE